MQRVISIHNLASVCSFCSQVRCLTTTPLHVPNQKWRRERGLPLNPNKQGVLTDAPDYTFLDGRITPYGTRQKTRILRQRETLKQILSYTKEVDFAVERHKMLANEMENKKRRILETKLKPKGIELLKASKNK